MHSLPSAPCLQAYIAALDPKLYVYDATTLQPLYMPGTKTQVSLAQPEHHKWLCTLYRPAAWQGAARKEGRASTEGPGNLALAVEDGHAGLGKCLVPGG